MRGYVYILVNPAMPGLVKIGMTRRSPAVRARELSGTAVPRPFRVAYSLQVEDCDAVEGRVHAALARHRENGKREFFRIDVSTARRVIEREARRFRSAPGVASIFSDAVEVIAGLTIVVGTLWLLYRGYEDQPQAIFIVIAAAFVMFFNGSVARRRRRRSRKP